MGFERLSDSEDTVLISDRKGGSSCSYRTFSGHCALTEQLSHDLSSFYRALPLGNSIELLCRPCAGTKECVTRYLGRGSFRCLINKRDVFSRQPFGFDQLPVFSIVPVIDPCLRHVHSPKNNRSTQLLDCTTEWKKSRPLPAWPRQLLLNLQERRVFCQGRKGLSCSRLRGRYL